MVRIKSLLDNLVLATSLVGVVPVYLFLDLPTRVIFPLALLLGAWGDRRNRYFLSAKPATFVSIAAFLFFALQVNRNYLVEPAINIAVLLLAVRLLSAKEGRHYLQIFILAGFALAGSSLLTLSLAFLPMMLLLVTGIICGLVLLCFHSDDPRLSLDRAGLSRLIRMALLLPAGSLLLAALFFFILPRTQNPLWDFLNPGSAKTGFSEEVRPGSFASTAADSSVAFRAEAPAMDPNELYWRVTVLDTLEGPIWKRSRKASQGSPAVIGGKRLELTIFPEASQGKFLATLDPPAGVKGVYNRRRTDGVYRYYRTAKLPQSYRVTAYLGGQIKKDNRTGQKLYLSLPDGLAPRARALVEQLLPDRTGSRDAAIEVIKDFFRNAGLTYATRDLATDGDPIDTFLFDEKRGYCEYFAASFAVMLREAGIPARLVGGYLGGQYNELGGYYIIGERMAHVWVEALHDDGTWQRIDPNLYAINADASLLSRSRERRPNWQQFADAVDYFWTQAVITFDFDRQIAFARSVRDNFRQWRREKQESEQQVWPIAALALTIILFIVWRQRRLPVETRLLKQFTRLVAKHVGGKAPPKQIGLIEMGRRLPGRKGEKFADIYTRALYRDRRLTPDEVTELKKLLREIGKES